jgi:hypothetical protein
MIFEVLSLDVQNLEKGRPGLSSTPLAGQVLGMIASGRQTAPPLHEVVLVTSHAVDLSLEASISGSDLLCAAPLGSQNKFRAEVYPHRATDFVSAASASHHRSGANADSALSLCLPLLN